MKSYNWRDIRRMVNRLDDLRKAYNVLSTQSIQNGNRAATEDALATLDQEIDAAIQQATADLLIKELRQMKGLD